MSWSARVLVGVLVVLAGFLGNSATPATAAGGSWSPPSGGVPTSAVSGAVGSVSSSGGGWGSCPAYPVGVERSDGVLYVLWRMRRTSSYDCDGSRGNNWAGVLSGTGVSATCLALSSNANPRGDGLWVSVVSLQSGCTSGTATFAAAGGTWGRDAATVTVNGPATVTVKCGNASGDLVLSTESGYGLVAAGCAGGFTAVGGSWSSASGSGSWGLAGYASNPAGVVACAGGGCEPVARLADGSDCPLGSEVPAWASVGTLSVRCGQIRDGDAPLEPDLVECEYRTPEGDGPPPVLLEPEDCLDYVAQYIEQHRQTEDQTNFGPLLDGINRVRRAVESVRDAVQSGVSGKLDEIRDAIAGIGLDPGGEGPPIDTGGLGGLEGPELPSGREGIPGQIAEKFEPWTDAVTGLIEAFDVADPGCEGPAVAIPWPVSQTVHPFSACDEPWATVALVFRTALGLSVVVGGALACVRLLTAAVGYHTGQSGGGSEDA